MSSPPWLRRLPPCRSRKPGAGCAATLASSAPFRQPPAIRHKCAGAAGKAAAIRASSPRPPTGWPRRGGRRERVENDKDEEQGRGGADIGADRGDEVPARKRRRVIRDAPRHARQTEEMHREEGQVDADKG